MNKYSLLVEDENYNIIDHCFVESELLKEALGKYLLKEKKSFFVENNFLSLQFNNAGFYRFYENGNLRIIIIIDRKDMATMRKHYKIKAEFKVKDKISKGLRKIK